MIVVQVEIQAAPVGKRSHARAQREALRQVAINHLRVMIPRHFTPQAASLYGYAPRNPAYMARKRRKTGAATPLVFTRQLSFEQRRTPFSEPNVTATQYGATLRLKSPHPLRERQWQELTEVIHDELAAHEEVAANIYVSTLKSLGARRVTTRITG